MKERLCSMCGKSMTNPETGADFIGMEIRVEVQDPTISAEFLQKQMGDYKLGKDYGVCFECWLKSLGVKP